MAMSCILGLMFSRTYQIVFLFFQLLSVSFCYCQNFEKTDSIVSNYPKSIANIGELANLINRDFFKPEDKVRAIFYWVSTTIAYDIDASQKMEISQHAFSYKSETEKNTKEKKFKEQLVNNALFSKKAVCHGYAALIESLCIKVGVESKIILGNLKSDPMEIGNQSFPINHAWNIIKINENWQFVDATLAAGFVSSNTDQFKFYFNDAYFFTDPDLFFLNHFPSDIKWLFVSKTKEDYIKLPLFMGYYLQFNYEIIKPDLGIHSVTKSDSFVFAIKNLKQSDYVSYSLNSEFKIKDIDYEDNTENFIIDLHGKEEDFLSIYVNRKLIVIYKITK
jgi:hypothetical protein